MRILLSNTVICKELELLVPWSRIPLATWVCFSAVLSLILNWA